MEDFIKYNHTIKSTTYDNSRGVNNRPDVPNVFHVLAIIVIGIVLLMFIGCRSLPQPTNTHTSSSDSVRTELRIDTIYKDRWHKEYQKGDTTFIHDSIDRWYVRYIYIHDSIDNSRIDTIYQTVETEKKGSEFLRMSGIAFWILIAAITILGVTLFIVFRK